MKKVYNLLVSHINHDNASNLLQSNHNIQFLNSFEQWLQKELILKPENAILKHIVKEINSRKLMKSVSTFESLDRLSFQKLQKNMI